MNNIELIWKTVMTKIFRSKKHLIQAIKNVPVVLTLFSFDVRFYQINKRKKDDF